MDVAGGAAGGSELANSGDWALSEPLVAGSGGASLCNPADWFCNDLTLGSAVNEGGRAKWINDVLKFRDDSESVNHYTGGNWGGIVGRIRADMAANAL